MTATERALELVHTAARAASDKLADDILAFDVSEQLVITDAFVLCSASNERQVKSIVDEIEDKLREIECGPSGARASATVAGCSSTTPRSWCTCSTPRSASSTRSSGCGATAR